MGSAAWLNCTGLDDLDAKTHSEVVVRPRRVLEPLCKDAGKTLTITKGDHRGDLNLDFDSDTDTRARELCPSSGLAICSARTQASRCSCGLTRTCASAARSTRRPARAQRAAS